MISTTLADRFVTGQGALYFNDRGGVVFKGALRRFSYNGLYRLGIAGRGGYNGVGLVICEGFSRFSIGSFGVGLVYVRCYDPFLYRYTIRLFTTRSIRVRVLCTLATILATIVCGAMAIYGSR